MLRIGALHSWQRRSRFSSCSYLSRSGWKIRKMPQAAYKTIGEDREREKERHRDKKRETVEKERTETQ